MVLERDRIHTVVSRCQTEAALYLRSDLVLLSSFLFFLGAISLSLGILNLLPIPVLDGGHLLYYLIELAKGSPVSDQMQAKGQYIGLMALFGLMGIAFFNDILRLVG